MNQKLKPAYPILVIDDEEAILMAIDTTLRLAGFNHIIACQDSRNAMALIAEHHAQVILMDLMMPHINGQELMVEIAAEFPDIPVIIITVAAEPKTVVKCMKMGAFDYLVKPVDADRLRTTVINAQHFSELQQENLALKNSMLTDEFSHIDAFSSIVTRNRKMLSIFKYLELISKTSQAVLITGETGVGKELVAKAIHELSGISGPFVSVNVAGLDDNIFSDTLFGHVKGAFTGADAHRMGLIEEAASGTLLLDEIGDLSLSSQVKLLRLLQESEYRPLGMDKTKKAHVRMVASTNEGLAELRNSGKFRKDLLFRLQVHHVHIPPLRDRLDDIGLLLNHFIRLAATELNKKVPSYPKELSALLQTYSFPGNIRELKAMVFDAVSRHTRGILTLQGFQNYLDAQRPHGQAIAPPEDVDAIVFPINLPTIEEVTQALLDEAMRRANGNQSLAARLLGISQQAVSKRLQKGK